jgi:hypothetical protein
MHQVRTRINTHPVRHATVIRSNVRRRFLSSRPRGLKNGQQRLNCVERFPTNAQLTRRMLIARVYDVSDGRVPWKASNNCQSGFLLIGSQCQIRARSESG